MSVLFGVMFFVLALYCNMLLCNVSLTYLYTKLINKKGAIVKRS